MDRFPLLFLLLFPQVFGSKGKTINPFENNSNEIKRRVVVGEHAFRKDDDLERHEVRPIEAGYNHQYSRKNNGQGENLTKPASRKRLRRCFCGLSPGASCPDGYLETHIQWNDPLVGPLVPPHFPAEGPPYDVGDEWAWVQDSYDGDLQQNAYGWNWKEKFNGNNPEGPQLGGYPCGQQGWCCCGEAGKLNDKASDAEHVKPIKGAQQHKQKDNDRIIINIARKEFKKRYW